MSHVKANGTKSTQWTVGAAAVGLASAGFLMWLTDGAIARDLARGAFIGLGLAAGLWLGRKMHGRRK